MVGFRETEALRRNVLPDGRPLSAHDRERLLRPYLPPTPDSKSPSRAPSSSGKPQKSSRSKPSKGFLRQYLYVLIYTVIHALFSAYIRVRRAYHAIVDHIFAVLYYHHRTPELIRKDVSNLSRLPQHLSVILDFNDDEQDGGGGLEGLVNDVGEIAAWCASAGIPVVSIYEKTGVLKSYIPQTHRNISRTLESYFGTLKKPSLSLRAPHLPTFSPPATPPSAFATASDFSTSPFHITVLLLSAEDGRSTLVDLTKTLAEMSQRGKLSPADISAELIDAEISESVMGEPDLLVLFGPRVELKGYPPWQVRLTEIYHAPDNAGVGYQTFLRALHRFAKAKMRFGR
ncbi:hypothetical protein W97_01103 [Coniosporium apollinis CBS 100218]|uniref:ditrans,polycis-polyprenyl diphosphate synthase [(2E,6E)-farnesyldiphosphate specific] n=1 Tax=Coniosporium apollinis (strain CBS 100218) TaxID=1168221 RepID=R7YIZ5_CONA1|nr:uncharacterized protein W97_01103 [Coniosporium apollinis CBS 100218]EON61885.1 hypothetical protein W97_01103 [Coniosporium apollinis CBS 100218]